MVPVRIRYDWRQISRESCLPALHCHNVRYVTSDWNSSESCANSHPPFLGPRFILVGLWYLLTRRPNSTLPTFVAYTGLFRTLTCGGWTYITSTDDHDWHDIFMISYLVATIPWTYGCLALSPPNPKAIWYRKLFAGLFFGTIIPLVYWFIQHKVHKVPGGTRFFTLL